MSDSSTRNLRWHEGVRRIFGTRLVDAVRHFMEDVIVRNRVRRSVKFLSPQIEQQVRAWAQAEGISFSLAVEHLLALGLADMHLKQFHEEMKWQRSFSEPNIAKMREEVRLWI